MSGADCCSHHELRVAVIQGKLKKTKKQKLKTNRANNLCGIIERYIREIKNIFVALALVGISGYPEELWCR